MKKINEMTRPNRPMSDKGLQQVTDSVSYIGHAPEPTRLTPKEEAFCIAVLSGQNPSDAYRAAYAPQRAKAKTIHEMSSRLMAKPKVRARIEMLMQPVIERAQLTREEWLGGLARICLADIRKMFDDHGNPIAITKFTDNEAAAIAGFEVYSDRAPSRNVSEVGGRTVRVRMVDQLKALEMYGKAMGYFAEQNHGCYGGTRRTSRWNLWTPPTSFRISNGKYPFLTRQGPSSPVVILHLATKLSLRGFYRRRVRGIHDLASAPAERLRIRMQINARRGKKDEGCMKRSSGTIRAMVPLTFSNP